MNTLGHLGTQKLSRSDATDAYPKASYSFFNAREFAASVWCYVKKSTSLSS